MPPNIATSTGVIQIEDRTANVHDIHYIREITDYAPLNKKARGMITMHLTDAQRGGTTPAKEFKWAVRPFNQRNGAVLDVYNDPALSSATATGTPADAIVYLAVTASHAKQYQEGDGIVLTNTASDVYTRLTLTVTGRKVATDTTSYIAARLDSTDYDNVLASASIRFNPGAASFPEIGTPPDSKFDDVTFYSNYVQLIRKTVKCGVDELKEKQRLNKTAWELMNKDTLLELNAERDQNFVWGVKKQLATNQYRTGGLKYWLTPANGDTVAGHNIVNWKTDTTYVSNSSATWLSAWFEFMRGIGEYGSRWAGEGIWKCYGGGLALEAINAGCVDRGYKEITTETDSYGFRFRKLVMLNGEFHLYQHPLYTNEPAYQRMLVCIRPELIDTLTYGNLDYTPADEYETKRTRYKTAFWELQEGYQVTIPDAHFILDGLGLDR
jgi:hypothetical protein